MLGQHPQMYGLPEMHLFVCNTMQQWWPMFKAGRTPAAHGILRAVSQINWGDQTNATIELSRIWLLRRRQYDIASVYKELAECVYPLSIVEKSPSTVYRLEYMQRALRTFPNAKFLHLLRHPSGYGRSLLNALEEFHNAGFMKRTISDFMINQQLRKNEGSEFNAGPSLVDKDKGLFDFNTDPPTFDPQGRWFDLHSNICRFLRTLPRDQWMRTRGEDLIADPDDHLREISDWMGLRTDPEAIEAMKHPERSPFACLGPSNAQLGNDLGFLENPHFRIGNWPRSAPRRYRSKPKRIEGKRSRCQEPLRPV